MALRHAMLAALLDGEASGYELAKRFDASVANFWHALPQQLYSELRRLEEQRLVSGRAVRQRGRPDKRVFTITPAGVEALRDFAAERVGIALIRESAAHHRRDVATVSITGPRLERRIALAWRADNLSPAARVFVASAEEM